MWFCIKTQAARSVVRQSEIRQPGAAAGSPTDLKPRIFGQKGWKGAVLKASFLDPGFEGYAPFQLKVVYSGPRVLASV